jgi:hypothetical protein
MKRSMKSAASRSRKTIGMPLVAFACALLVLGCDDGEKAKEEAAKAAASAKAAEAQQAQLAAAKAADAKKKEEAAKPQRPTTIETEVTDGRRAAIEGAYSEAKGFVVATTIEEALKKDKKISAKEAAVKAFDKQAKGKWVVFSGPMVNLTDSTFDLAVTFTPRAENDPMGMSRQFFTITLSDIEGYEKDKFKAGAMVVVLAKYDGGTKASKGYELIETGKWK